MAPETAQKLTELDIRTSKSYGVANVHKRLDIFGRGNASFISPPAKASAPV